MEKVTVQLNFRTNYVRTGEIVRGFGVCDGKGREIGSRVTLGECDRKIRSAELWAGTPMEAVLPEARLFVYCPHAMRSGKLFGASQREMAFSTKEERDAAVEKYFASAAKRAGKAAA